MEQIGLVLQGGGLRGVYTSGVLDFFMEQNLYFPYVIGVYAGACNGSSYLSRQKGLGKIMMIDFINDSRYINFKNLLRNKSIFGMDFIFNEIPTSLHPFHFDKFHSCKEQFKVGVTDCHTGQCVFFEKKECIDLSILLRASCSSVPFVTSMVDYEGKQFLDGGISSPIPINQSLKDGNARNVVILTNGGSSYMKEPIGFQWLSKLWAKKLYPRYKQLITALVNHYQVYNETLRDIFRLEAENKIFVSIGWQPPNIPLDDEGGLPLCS